MKRVSLEEIIDCESLPSAPVVAVRVLELCRRSTAGTKEIAATLATDPALCARLLKVVNSSLYGLRQPVSTVRQAVLLLGIDRVKTVAIGFSFIKTLSEQHAAEFDVDHFAMRSVYAGVAAQLLAEAAGHPEPEEAFVGGLLQDVGLLAMAQAIGHDYVHVLNAAEDHAGLTRKEEERFGFDHAHVGAALADRWKLPAGIVSQIRYHSRPETAARDLAVLTQAASLGGMTARLLLATEPISMEVLIEAYDEGLELSAAQTAALLHKIEEAARKVAKLFNLRPASAVSADMLIQQANAVLEKASLTAARNLEQAEKTNQRLREALRVDALTELPTRHALNEHIAARAVEGVRENPLGLIYLDLDGFTAINRRFGDAGGDRIIQRAGQLLQSKLPGSAELYRHEADEFVVLLPSGDGRRTVELAKRLRAAMAEAEWPVRSAEPLKLTVAAGVLAWPADRPLPEPEALIEGARAACRHAVHAGGNRLRVLEPGEFAPQSV